MWITSSALLPARAVEGVRCDDVVVRLGAVFTRIEYIEIVQGMAHHPIRWEATCVIIVTSHGRINGVGMIILQPVLIKRSRLIPDKRDVKAICVTKCTTYQLAYEDMPLHHKMRKI